MTQDYHFECLCSQFIVFARISHTFPSSACLAIPHMQRADNQAKHPPIENWLKQQNYMGSQ